jgi:hypothetical protein
MPRYAHALGLAAFLLATPSLLLAKAPPEEVARLGKELTAIGAVRAANADGSIPEWTGPSNFTDEQRRLTPKQIEDMPGDELEKLFSGGRAIEAPKFTITRANMAQYEDKLTEGHKAMLRQYATYKMPVYTSIRSGHFPREVEEATIKNAATAVLEGSDVKGAVLGFPFPVPQRPEEVMWNHRMKFRGATVRRYNNQAIVQPDGSYTITKLIEDVKFVYSNLKNPPPPGNRIMLYYLSEYLSPPRITGQFILATEPVQGLREAYIYNPQVRRVRRVPDAGYDNPTEGSDNSQTYDQIDMYNGALDRYTWKLVGKKEMYIPYNSFKLDSPSLKYDDVIKAGHINQDLTRYELHRVWEVEATLKSGERHIYAKRHMYFDEDSWQLALVDHYDGRGQLWRVAEGHAQNYYHQKVPAYTLEALYDVVAGRYLALGMKNEEKSAFVFGFKASAADYTPGALRSSGVR